VAASVDRVKDDPVRGLDSGSPVQLTPKDLDEVGIFCKQRRDAHAVVSIPAGFNFFQDCLNIIGRLKPGESSSAQPLRPALSPIVRLADRDSRPSLTPPALLSSRRHVISPEAM
jgi:hypothetical protein